MKESGTMRQISQNGLSFPLQDRLRAKEKISINKYEKAELISVLELDNTERGVGGIGHTGIK